MPPVRAAASRESPRKAWCFTWNNYSEDEFTTLCAVLSRECEYAVVGKEVGASGTRHLQGYFSAKEKRRLAQIKNTISRSAHFEPARGTAQRNRQYCSKDGDVWEHGVCPGRVLGKSRDVLAKEFVACAESSTLEVFRDENPGVAYFSGHLLLRNFLASKRPVDRPDVRARWIWGPPGTGKSRFAHSEFPMGYVKEPRTKWWTGYMLEREVIIDDFGKGGIDINHLLRWFDRYRCLVETKGDMVALYATQFIVTSNFRPDEIFVDEHGNNHHQLPALERRIDIIYMGFPDIRQDSTGAPPAPGR